MRLGLVAALPEEARALARVVSGARRERVPGLGSGRGRGRAAAVLDAAGSPHHPPAARVPVTSSPHQSLLGRPAAVHLLGGTLAGQAVTIAWAGAGAARAAAAATVLLERGVEALLAVGFAGALSPALRPGDLIVATEVLAPDGECWPAAPGWLAVCRRIAAERDGCSKAIGSAIITVPNQPRGARPPALHLGRLATAAQVVSAASEKRRLGQQTEALAVDMESAAVARCAAAAGMPMLAVRAITDAADVSLPPDIELCFDSDGQFRYLRLIGLLMRRPSALGGLTRLGRHSAQAGQTLASFLASSLPRCAGPP